MEGFELNDHERVEMIKQFFKKYGNALILVLLIILVLISAWHFWGQHQDSINRDAAESYQGLLTSVASHAPPDQQVAQASALIQNYPKTAYANLARLFIAQVAVSENKLPLAESTLRELVQKSTGDLRALSTVRLARVLIAEQKPQQALTLLSAPPKGYEPLYQLLIGDSDIALGDTKNASIAYQAALAVVGDNDPLRALLVSRLSNLPTPP